MQGPRRAGAGDEHAMLAVTWHVNGTGYGVTPLVLSAGATVETSGDPVPVRSGG